jgi:hypothetical protein
MSKHPLDVVSLVFGVVFGVMALAGLGSLTGIVDDGLVVALAGILVAIAVAGVVLSARRLRSS